MAQETSSKVIESMQTAIRALQENEKRYCKELDALKEENASLKKQVVEAFSEISQTKDCMKALYTRDAEREKNFKIMVKKYDAFKEEHSKEMAVIRCTQKMLNRLHVNLQPQADLQREVQMLKLSNANQSTSNPGNISVPVNDVRFGVIRDIPFLVYKDSLTRVGNYGHHVTESSSPHFNLASGEFRVPIKGKYCFRLRHGAVSSGGSGSPLTWFLCTHSGQKRLMQFERDARRLPPWHSSEKDDSLWCFHLSKVLDCEVMETVWLEAKGHGDIDGLEFHGKLEQKKSV